MVTVLRSGGLRVVIYLNDHEPAHVHVIGDGEAKIDLGSADAPPALIWAKGASAAELRRAMRLVIENRDMLLTRWAEIHG